MDATGHNTYRRYATVVVLGFAATLWLSGCASFSGNVSTGSGDGGPTASAVRDPVLQDIPKPAGFALSADKSIAISSGRFRQAKCEYTGSLPTDSVKRFYEEYMPGAGFELRQWGLDRGEYSMRFESSTEVCTVRTRPMKWNTTTLIVELVPKPQGSTERDSKPPARRPN